MTLTDISSRAWEHPADRGALVALRKLKGFDTVLKALSGLFNERSVRLLHLGSSVRVDERQFPVLHRLLGEVGRTLDVAELPELFVANSPFSQAMTIGMDKPIIVVNSSLLDLLDEDELRFVLAHELGHALSGHAVYRTLLQRLINLGGVLSSIPGGALGCRGIVAALYEWSAQGRALRRPGRAARHPGPGHRLPGAHEARQRVRRPLRARPDLVLRPGPGVRSTPATCATPCSSCSWSSEPTHPFAVVRAAELRRWVDAGDYTAVLTAAPTPAATTTTTAGVTDAAKEAAASYGETLPQQPGRRGPHRARPRRVRRPAKVWLRRAAAVRAAPWPARGSRPGRPARG